MTGKHEAPNSSRARYGFLEELNSELNLERRV